MLRDNTYYYVTKPTDKLNAGKFLHLLIVDGEILFGECIDNMSPKFYFPINDLTELTFYSLNKVNV